MRDHSKHIELDRFVAVDAVLADWEFQPGEEEIPLSEAFGRTLSRDALSTVTMPNCLTCNMDSIALHWSDFENGMPDYSGWTRGVEWQFANTGVGMPVGFDTAICIENAVVSEDNTTLEKIIAAPSCQFAGTSPEGSRIKEGDLVVKAGTVVTPAIAAALASAGHTSALVVVPPRVTFIPTGNELVAPGEEIGRGKNIESNSLIIQGKCLEWDADCQVYPIIPDDPEAITAAIRQACAESDIVILNAGSSKGSDDWAMELLEQLGHVYCHETNHGPGHHSSMSMVEGTPIVGISGPSLGANFTTDFYLKPLVNVWYGRTPEPSRILVRLAEPFKGKGPKKGDAPKAAKGEDRPSFLNDGRKFFSIQHLVLSQAADGVIEARPLAFRPGLVASDAAQAFYGLDGSNPPEVGDLIEVEVRGRQVY